MTSIEDGAFSGCSGLTSITIPNSVTIIESETFYCCSGLTSITLGNSVTSIGDYAFYGCSGLTSITIPNSVTSIGNYAFYHCSGLTSLELHCNSIGSWFRGNTSIKEIVIGNEVTSIEPYAFSGCSGLTSVTIGNGVTSICNNAFSYCSGLSSMTIPNSVTSIGDGAFRGCSGLTSVTIPNSVTSIGYDAFSGCYGLTAIYITDLAAWCGISFRSYYANPLCDAHHLFLNGTEIKNLVIPNGVTSIGDYTFCGCSDLTSLTIENGVTSIGGAAFDGCSGLTSVTIPNSVISIGNGAFQNCGLTSVTIPNSVTSIGGGAFYGCSGLTSVSIGNSVTSIGEGAFLNSTILLTVNSEIMEPFNCSGVFAEETQRKGVLYIPAGTKDLYTRFDGWREFLKIEEVGSAVPQQYFLSFVVENKELSAKKVDKGEAITPPEKDENGNSISWYTYPETMPAHDLVVYGMVPKPDAPVKYTITYVLDGQTYRTVIVEEGAAVSKEKAPYKEGYTFNGWQNEPTTMPGNDVTVNGTFSVNTYSLKFVVDNTELSTQSVQYGSTITAPTKDNEGNDVTWYTYPTTMPTHDLVIYGIAIIQPEPEVFVWLTVKDGQSGTTKIEVKQGTEQRLNINPEEGWKLSAIMMENDDVTAQLQSDGTFVTPALTSDATLTIVYEQKTPSGVRTTTQSKADVKVVSDGVVISNAEPDTRCMVYQTDGQQVVNTVINEGTQKIALQKGQTYILSINGRTLKFAL